MADRIVVSPRRGQQPTDALDALIDRLAEAKTLAEVRAAATEARKGRPRPAPPA